MPRGSISNVSFAWAKQQEEGHEASRGSGNSFGPGDLVAGKEEEGEGWAVDAVKGMLR